MKTLILLLFSLSCYGQQTTFVQVAGEVIRPPNDTIKIEVFNGGRIIDTQVFIGKFYEFQIGVELLYIIKTSSGVKSKYCYVNTNFMKTEKINVDIDFTSEYNSEIYLEKPNDKYFTMRLYDRYRVKYTEIERTTSEY